MWIYLNNSFLSIIANKEDKDLLHVRGRRSGDIEAIFPAAEPTCTPHSDYLYRADIPREDVARAMHDEAMSIDYTNFKGSVGDFDRHDEYLDVWSVMCRKQWERAEGGEE